MLLNQDLYIAAGAKMAETGYQYDNCDHNEAIQNVFEIALPCSTKDC